MHPMTTCLLFDHEAEEAAKFYTSVFKNSKLGNITHYGEFGTQVGQTPGKVLTVEFELNGEKFMALNGPISQFTEAISFVVPCDTQQELDYYWEKLSEGGNKNAQQCGWLKDKYGVSWQLVPATLPEMMKDPQKFERVMQAVMQMKKLDIAKLQEAYGSSKAPSAR